MGLFVLCPCLSGEHMDVSWYLCLHVLYVYCSLLLLLHDDLIRVYTCFRPLVTLYIPLVFCPVPDQIFALLS